MENEKSNSCFVVNVFCVSIFCRTIFGMRSDIYRGKRRTDNKLEDMKNDLGGKLSHDKKVEEDYIASPLNLMKYKIRLAGTMFLEGVKYIHANMDKFNCPVIYLHGKDDLIVEVESSEWLYDNNPVLDKQIVIYEGMYHEILNEIDKDMVIEDILYWLNNHL